MSELHWTEVDHVVTIWTEAPAPLRAGLLFRTGRIDETLASAGHTHLVEHLALSTLGETTQPHNGFVGPVMTGFVAMGSPGEVSCFYAEVCETLQSLPDRRLEGEKQVLAAEGAMRPYDVCANLLTWRYGAKGYGLVGMTELGIPGATLEQLRELVAGGFTRDNAVLWLSGPPPDDLRLRLPRGAKRPLPELAPLPLPHPSWFLDDACRGVAAGAIVPRSPASSAFREIAFRRLRKRLRTELAISYAPQVFYEPLTADVAHLVLYADSDPERRAELAEAFGAVLEELAGVEESEVAAAAAHIRECWTGSLAPPPADMAVADAQRAAMDWIFGTEYESLDSIAADIQSVTSEDVAEFFREVEATAMFALPTGAPLRPAFGERAPVCTSAAVEGRVIHGVDAPMSPERLVSSPDGVSILFPDESHCTVRYSDLAGALFYEDAGVCLIGADAATVTVEPGLWRGGRKAGERIRERVPEPLVLDRRSRPADAVPKPVTTKWRRLIVRLFHVRMTRREYGLWAAGLLLAVAGAKLGLGDPVEGTTAASILDLVYLATVLGFVAAGMRRVHDMGMGAWFVGFIMVIPGLNLGTVAFLLFWPGTRGPNKFGPDPRNRVANRPAA